MLGQLLNLIRQVSLPLRVEAQRLRGRTHGAGAELTVLYVGNGTNLPFVKHVLFDEANAENLGHATTPLSTRLLCARHCAAADLVVTDLPALWDRLIGVDAKIRVASWMRQVLELKPNAHGNGRLLSRHVEREAARHIRRQGFE